MAIIARFLMTPWLLKISFRDGNLMDNYSLGTNGLEQYRLLLKHFINNPQKKNASEKYRRGRNDQSRLVFRFPNLFWMGASKFSPDRLKSILLDKRPCNFDMPGFDDGVHFSTE